MIPRDKQLHILAGFTFGIFPAIFLPLAGTVTAALAGLWKEYEDGHGNTRGTVDPDDWTATLVGGVLADAAALLGGWLGVALVSAY